MIAGLTGACKSQGCKQVTRPPIKGRLSMARGEESREGGSETSHHGSGSLPHPLGCLGFAFLGEQHRHSHSSLPRKVRAASRAQRDRAEGKAGGAGNSVEKKDYLSWREKFTNSHFPLDTSQWEHHPFC